MQLGLFIAFKAILVSLVNITQINKITPEQNGSQLRNNRIQLPSEAGGTSKQTTVASTSIGLENNSKNTKKQILFATSEETKSILQRLNSYFNTSFFVYLLNSMLLDILLASILNTYSLPWKANFRNILSHTLSLLIIFLYFYMTSTILSIMVRLEMSRKDKIENVHIKTKYKRWLFLRLPLKPSASLLSRFLPEFILVGDILVCLVLVIFQSSGLLQLIPILIWKFMVILILVKIPLKDVLDTAMITLNEIMFFLILGFFSYN